MLRFTVCGLVAGLLAVTAVPLDETTTELPPLTTTDKPISLDDVMKDSDVQAVIYLLKDCFYQNPHRKDDREAIEGGLRDLMNRKKFSKHIESVRFIIFMSRNLQCPSPYSYLTTSTATPSDNEAPVTQQSNEPNAQEPSYNVPESNKPSDLVDQSSDSQLGQSIESSSNNNEAPVTQQSNEPNPQESSENLEKPIADNNDQQY